MPDEIFELYESFPKQYISQGHFDNATPFYKENQMSSHGGYDYVVPFDTKGPCCAYSYVYSTRNSPDPSKYRAVYTLIEDTGTEFVYELAYGHCNEIYVKAGQYVNVGDILYSVGNTGDVFTGGVKVTPEEQRAGSKRGAHLHIQLRKCRLVEATRWDRQYLHDGNGILFRKGKYYEIVDYDNGVHGLVDYMEYSNGRVAVPAYGNLDLSVGDVELITEKLRDAGLIKKRAKDLIEYIKRLVTFGK